MLEGLSSVRALCFLFLSASPQRLLDGSVHEEPDPAYDLLGLFLHSAAYPPENKFRQRAPEEMGDELPVFLPGWDFGASAVHKVLHDIAAYIVDKVFQVLAADRIIDVVQRPPVFQRRLYSPH